MTTIESELEYLRKKLTMYSKLYEKREWKTQDGDVLWWRFPFATKPYVGKPTDDSFPSDHTHWQRIVVPYEPLTNGKVI